jgi:hypothetical protein
MRVAMGSENFFSSAKQGAAAHNRKGKMKEKATKRVVFDSMSQMAAACNIPLEVLKSAKKAGCLFVKYGRCNLETFTRWYFDPANKDALDQDWTRRGKRADALRKECQLEKFKETVVDAALMREQLAMIEDCFTKEFERVFNHLNTWIPGNEAELARQKKMTVEKMQSRLAYWRATIKTLA